MSSSSSSLIISPGELHSDLYCLSDDPPATPLVISVLASLIERALAKNQRFIDTSKDARSRAFDSYILLDMTIQAFLERIFKYAKVSSPVYVVAYVYMDRLCQLNPGLHVTHLNVHRLLITTIMVASKFVEDMNYRNSYFAQVAGLKTAELNRSEMDFLLMMGFKLNVSVSVFESYCKHLEREVGYGGGYQIERTLRLICREEIDKKENGRRDSRKQHVN